MPPRRILPLTLLSLLAACGRLTADNYDKLKTGMTYDEVKAIIGAPTTCSDVLGVKNCTWGDDKRHVNASFVGGKLMLTTAENIR